jgi:4-alpha-glucanotransferase
MAANGLSVWQFLPTGPTGYGNSPYQPLSVFAGNPLLIDLDGLAELGLLCAHELQEYPELPDDQVDFARVILAKLDYLDRAAERFPDLADTTLADEYAAFLDSHDAVWLHDYALYQALKRGHGQSMWADWVDEYRARDARALEDLAESARPEIDRIKLGQFFFFRQWQGLRAYAADKGVLLFGDLPIYMAFDCAEAWSRPELLHLDAEGRPTAVAGVPPDYFSADGQRWGNPLYRWEAHEAEGFAWWIRRLRHSLELADLVRLDHFRGFEAYWSIPADAPTAREGQWLPGPGERFFAAIRAALGDLPIVAEDLGVITEAVTALRRRFGLPGMEVLQFLADQPGFEPGAIAEDCACYTGTHDNDTTLGWFGGSGGRLAGDELARFQAAVLANTGGAPQNVHKDMIRMAFESRAILAIAPMQDFLGLGSEARLNTPGESVGNWRWRLTQAQLDESDWSELRHLAARTARL